MSTDTDTASIPLVFDTHSLESEIHACGAFGPPLAFELVRGDSGDRLRACYQARFSSWKRFTLECPGLPLVPTQVQHKSLMKLHSLSRSLRSLEEQRGARLMQGKGGNMPRRLWLILEPVDPSSKESLALLKCMAPGGSKKEFGVSAGTSGFPVPSLTAGAPEDPVRSPEWI